MISLAVTGCGVLSAAGVGPGALAAALSWGCIPEQNARGLGDDPLPPRAGYALSDFQASAYLGRKGTTFLDRGTGLVLVACGRALEDSGLGVADESRHRIGVVLGTTMGSLKSMSDFARECLVEDRPYLVNPMRFPNTVMNFAAGQVAIWYGLKGVNATVAGGPLALFNALRYASNIVQSGYADVMLAGTFEEFTPHSAWAAYCAEPSRNGAPIGEGAAVFVVERADWARGAGRRVWAEVCAVVSGFGASDGGGTATAGALSVCIARALASAKIEPSDLALVIRGGPDDAEDDSPEARALAMALPGTRPVTCSIAKVLGECHAASGGMQMASLLALHREESGRDGRFSLLIGHSREGGVGAAVVRGGSRVGPHHG
jgi:3-oxoacyl-[acyl-carrier-protein] synthase II